MIFGFNLDDLATLRAENERLRSERDEWRAVIVPKGGAMGPASAKKLLEAAADELSRLRQQLAEARKFAEDAAAKYNVLLAESQEVTCAFCGQTYPRGTPRHGDGALAEHVTVCEQHPLREAERQLAQLSKEFHTAINEPEYAGTRQDWIDRCMGAESRLITLGLELEQEHEKVVAAERSLTALREKLERLVDKWRHEAFRSADAHDDAIRGGCAARQQSSNELAALLAAPAGQPPERKEL